jgi:hypothetical protein
LVLNNVGGFGAPAGGTGGLIRRKNVGGFGAPAGRTGWLICRIFVRLLLCWARSTLTGTLPIRGARKRRTWFDPPQIHLLRRAFLDILGADLPFFCFFALRDMGSASMQRFESNAKAKRNKSITKARMVLVPVCFF